MGVTTALRLLEKEGHPPVMLARKPPPKDRHTFHEQYLAELVQAWEDLPRKGAAQLVEDSPWAYYAKHSAGLTPDQRHHYCTRLAQLTLPELTIILHAAGRTIGTRHPLHHATPDAHSPLACEQARALDFIPGSTRHVDATSPPAAVCRRLLAILNSKVFESTFSLPFHTKTHFIF